MIAIRPRVNCYTWFHFLPHFSLSHTRRSGFHIYLCIYSTTPIALLQTTKITNQGIFCWKNIWYGSVFKDTVYFKTSCYIAFLKTVFASTRWYTQITANLPSRYNETRTLGSYCSCLHKQNSQNICVNYKKRTRNH